MAKISVILTVFNGERFLADAIQSILDQTYGNFELIIIDDGSTDGSLDIIKSVSDDRIKLIVNESNRGQSYSRNRGIDLAKGEYIAIMDADDIAYPHRLNSQLDFLNGNPDISLCASWADLIDEKGIVFGQKKCPSQDAEIKIRLLFYCPIIHPTVMFRKFDFVRNHLKYDEYFVYAQDFDLWSRAMKCLKFEAIPEPLIQFRFKHSGSISNANVSKQRMYAEEILKRSMRDFVGLNYSIPANNCRQLRIYRSIINSKFLNESRSIKVNYLQSLFLSNRNMPFRLKKWLRTIFLN